MVLALLVFTSVCPPVFPQTPVQQAKSCTTCFETTNQYIVDASHHCKWKPISESKWISMPGVSPADQISKESSKCVKEVTRILQERWSRATQAIKEGQNYSSGNGVPKDLGKAAQLYREAAELGDPEGETRYGVVLLRGVGVTRDYSQAIIWIRKAAEQGFGKAQDILGLIYAAGAGVAVDYNQAFLWTWKAAEQGIPTAEWHLGELYAKGIGVSVNREQAAIWYRKAAAAGVQAAQNELAELPSAASGTTSAMEPALQQQSDNQIPDVQYRLNAKAKQVTDAEEQKLSASLRWVPNDVSFGVGALARSDLLDGSGRTLASVRINWNSADQRFVMTPASQGLDAWKNAPQIWYGKFTAQLQNNSLCSIRPEAELTLPDKDIHVVDSVAWTNWLTLHYPSSGQQDLVQHEFVIPQVSPTLVLHMRSPQPFSPLSSCMKVVEQTMEKPKSAAQAPDQTASSVSRRTASCDWSPEFDQIRDEDVLSGLRSAANSGQSVAEQTRKSQIPLQQLVAGAKQTLTQMQDHLQQTIAAIQSVSQPPVTDFNFGFNYGQACKNNPDKGALLAAECEYVNTMNMMHMTKGALEIYSCMAGN
jgi:TPR repeat protein